MRGAIHTSTAVVVVFITDVNDNKPIFQDCASYVPKIEEGAPNGSPVIKVHAIDEDKGVNGQVSRYKVKHLFEIDSYFLYCSEQETIDDSQNL